MENAAVAAEQVLRQAIGILFFTLVLKDDAINIIVSKLCIIAIQMV